LYRKIYSEVNSNTTSRLATWRRQANEIAMRRHFATTTGRRRRVFKSDRNWSSLNATMAPQGYMITVYRFITNIFYKYRRCTNFVRVSQTQTTFIYCDPICIRF